MTAVKLAIATVVLLIGTFLTSPTRQESPRETYVTTPIYPPMARVARETATVTVKAEVASDGTVQRAAVVAFETNTKNPGGKDVFSVAVLSNVRQWRFEPAASSDVKREATVQYVFRLEGEPDPCARTRVSFEFPGTVEIVATPPAGFN